MEIRWSSNSSMSELRKNRYCPWDLATAKLLALEKPRLELVLKYVTWGSLEIKSAVLSWESLSATIIS